MDLRMAAEGNSQEDRDVRYATHPEAPLDQAILEGRYGDALVEEQQHEFHAPYAMLAYGG